MHIENIKRRILLFLLYFFIGSSAWAQSSGGSVFDQSRNVLSKSSQYLARARQIFNQATSSDAYDKLVNGEEVEMPVSIPYNQPSSKYEIRLDSIVLTSKNAYGVVFLRLNTSVFSANDAGQDLYFASPDIKFTKNGGFTGDASIFLLQDVEVKMGNKVKMTIFAQNPLDQSATYAKFNCDGFQELHLSGALTFDKSLMREEEASGKTLDKDVTVYFETTIKDWDNWIVEINKIPAFQLTSLAGFSWSVDAFVLDKSITDKSSDFIVPDGYSLDYVGGSEEMWTGIFFRNITVKLPKEFKKKSQKTTDRITISGSKFLIDQQGVTGELLGLDIISDGDIGKWTYTLDTVKATLVMDQLVSAGFAGTLDMPLAKKKSGSSSSITSSGGDKFGLAYTGSISVVNNTPEYTFSVKSLDELDFSLWKVAKGTIQSAQITVVSSNGNFKGSLLVTGDLTVSPSFKKKDGANENAASATAITMTVEELRLNSYKSYWGGVKRAGIDLDIPRKDGGDKPKSKASSLLSRLPISVDKKIDILSEDDGNRLGVQFKLIVNLMKSDGNDSKSANGFNGDATMIVWAKQDQETDKWKYDKTELTTIHIAVHNGGFDLEGWITRYGDDKKYGEGFEGKLKAKFKPGIEVTASAMFGRVAASATEPADPTVMLANYDSSDKPEEKGANGKVVLGSSGTYRYWYVDASVKFPSAIPIFTGIGINAFMGGAYHHMVVAGNSCDPAELGCAASGTKFEPADSIFLGVRAGVGIVSMPSDVVFSGNLLFGIEFLEGGGINRIYFDGLAKFVNFGSTIDMSKVKELSAKMGNSGDRPQSCEQGLSVGWHTEYNFVTSTFSGTFDVKVNVQSVVQGIHDQCSAGLIELYFSPDDWYLYVGRPLTPIGLDVLGVVKVSSYFIVGSKLPVPAIAPMPDGVGGTPVDPTLLNVGGGIGMGVRIATDFNMSGEFGGKLCSFGGGVKAGFEAGLDVLLSKDKAPISCNGYDPRGINRWYATGQVYLLAWGDVFLNYDCGVLGSGDINLLTLRFSAYIFGQLPRPTYFEGEIRASATLLDICTVNCKFDFKYKDICSASVTAGDKTVAIVSRIFPSDTIDLQGVYTVPKATLKHAVNSKFAMAVSRGTEQVEILDPTFDVKAVLANGTSKVISGKVTYNDAKTDVSFVPNETLPENADIFVTMNLKFSSGDVIPKSWRFKTITEPEKIENTNILYSYPLPQMKNMYKATSTAGYIRLKTLPAKPLTLPTGYKFEVRYKKGGSQLIYANTIAVKKVLNVDQFEFVIPTEKLETSTDYTLQIVKTKSVQQTDERDYSTGAQSGDAGGMVEKEDIVILEYTFRTSGFATFEEKMATFGKGMTQVDDRQGIVTVEMNSTTASGVKLTTEGFGSEELRGYLPTDADRQEPLIKLIATNGETIRAGLTAQGIGDNERFKGVGEAGPKLFPPIDAVHIEERGKDYMISYEVPKYLNEGLNEYMKQSSAMDDRIRVSRALNAISNTNTDMTIMNSGEYMIAAKYYLPGKTSSAAQTNIRLDVTKPININIR